MMAWLISVSVQAAVPGFERQVFEVPPSTQSTPLMTLLPSTADVLVQGNEIGQRQGGGLYLGVGGLVVDLAIGIPNHRQLRHAVKGGDGGEVILFRTHAISMPLPAIAGCMPRLMTMPRAAPPNRAFLDPAADGVLCFFVRELILAFCCLLQGLIWFTAVLPRMPVIARLCLFVVLGPELAYQSIQGEGGKPVKDSLIFVWMCLKKFTIRQSIG